MLGYLFKILYLVLFSFLVINVYYNVFDFHKESFEGYLPYVISVWLIYLLYKWYNFILAKKEVVFTPVKIFWFFLLHLFLLCVLFFTLNESTGSLWFQLFFQILGFLVFPILLVFIFLSFGKFLLQKISWFQEETKIFQFLVSLWVGFFVFVTVLTLFWLVWWYNIYVVFGLIVGMIWLSYKEFLSVLKGCVSYEIKILDHTWWDEQSGIFSKINPYLLSSEFLFIVITFLISVNFINIVRPMPIGWDDLWVYMNYPNLMAGAGSLLNLWGMYAWQVFTGIGYMFFSSTQAFFLNNVGGILAFLVIVLSFSDLLKSSKKTFLNIPLLAGTIFLAMPMIIFQLAKDMKLDPGLFFVSGLSLYMTYYLFLKYLWYKSEKNIGNVTLTTEKNTENETLEVSYVKQTKHGFTSYFTSFTHIGEEVFSNKKNLIYIGIIWILAGFAFSIKFTSLLLISALIGIFFYAKLWVAWFLWYISFYIALFTGLWLWEMMNVVFSKNDMLIYGGMFVSFVLFFYSLNKYGVKAIQKLWVLLSIFLVWVFLWVSPWVGKNIVSTGSLSISSILNGKSDNFVPDYLQIYSPEELDIIKLSQSQTSMTESGTSSNEDLGRYFWYEKWVNNYLKLPYNLTMQTNQRGEYTDITFIYLALIPLILFLSFKSGVFVWGAFIYLLFPLFFFFYLPINQFFTYYFSQFELPFWYAVIFIFFLLPFLYFIYTLKKDKFSVLFKLNLVFGMFYVFLWTISAFGIVWYGVVMYYSILFAFSIALYYLCDNDDTQEFKVQFFQFFGSVVVFWIISTYFFLSTFPHGFNNLKESSYSHFKAGMYNNYIAIFEAQPTYYNVLVELNIQKEKQPELVDYIISKTNNPQIKEVFSQNNISDLIALNEALKQLSNLENPENTQTLRVLKSEAKNLRSQLYKKVLYPSKEFQNTKWIYRIGTFLKYFIANNHSRLLEDSLVFDFETYFYDEEDLNVWIERMKKVWVEYFLVDLNAATIDKDPARNLTKRYEKLLATFTSDKLELIHTDSICLKLALEEYWKSQKSPEDYQNYLTLAGVNYESYKEDGEVINRGVKQLQCYNRILELMQEEGRVNEQNYSYLVPIINYLNANQINTQEWLLNFFRTYVTHGWMVLFRIQ